MLHDILGRMSYYKSWIWNIKPYLISFNVAANYSIWIEGRGGCMCRWNFITLSKRLILDENWYTAVTIQQDDKNAM